MSFEEIRDVYWMRDRTLFGLFESDDAVTLRFDLYRCDDDERAQDGTEYLLDVALAPERFRIESGSGERLRGNFSADILEATITGDEMRLVADCSFYDPPKGHDIVIMVLSDGTASVTEYPPTEAV